MQVMTGNRFDNTMREWDELLAKFEKRLADSEECFRRFGDEDSRKWVEEDRAKVAEIKAGRDRVEQNMRARGWRPSSEEASA